MKTALVTGAARRLGREIALCLAREGYAIAAHYGQSEDAALTLKMEIEAGGGRCALFQADLSSATETNALFDGVLSKAGAPEVLVNNASGFVNDDIRSFDVTHFETSMAVNLSAPLILSSRFAASAPADTNAVIINMLDNKLSRLNPDFFSYTIAKYALMGATEMMAIKLAPAVRVVGIAPSVTLISGKQNQENFDRSRKLTLMQRGPEVAHILETVLYLIRTDIITGQVIAVDGGQIHMNLPRDVAFLVKERIL